MISSARVSTKRPEITWMIPYRHTWRRWIREFRGGLMIPRFIGLFWLAIGGMFLDAAIPALAILGIFVAVIYWQFPEAEMDFAFWAWNVTRVGLQFFTFGSLVMAVFMLLALSPEGVSIYPDRIETHPLRRVMLDQVETARIIIEHVDGHVEHTLWLVTAEVASSFPLDPEVSHDRLRECLPCDVTVDDRRRNGGS